MSEIDLIPVRYARRCRIRSWMKRAAIVYAAVFLGIAGIRIALEVSNSNYGEEIAAFELERDQSLREQEELARLEQERWTLARRLEVLEGIRGDGVATEMFRVVDESLDANVWFRSWTFSRADEIVAEPDRAVHTGFFIVLPKESSDEPERAWRRSTHMEILADAEDHTALAGFVRRLAKKPEIDKARIVHTQSQARGGREEIEFEVAVTLRGPR